MMEIRQKKLINQEKRIMNRKKAVIGMSGGVDSSVGAYLLREQGYEVIGVTLNHKKEKSLIEEIKAAQRICDFLGIKHKIIDIEELFQKEVIDDFLEGYSQGITPSPCVICDERVKMRVLFETADEEGAYFVATGHYSSVEYSEEFKTNLLKVSYDPRKDQSYMLYRLDTDKISRLIFPLHSYEKKQIREIAKSIGLEVHDKGDSQGICFAKEGYIEFLRKNLGDKIKKGNFIDNNGNIMGEHEGYQLYTIGQRRGLGLKLPRAYFITKINKEKNEITIGEYEELYQKRVELKKYKLSVKINDILDKNIIGRPRFSSFGASGKILFENEKLYFEFDEENPQTAPGQHLVLYYKNLVLGGGIIS